MQQLVSPFVPFPNIFWWSLAQNCTVVTFDQAEHFEKMSYRNRYYITGANGLIQLSIPLQRGRNQRLPMHEVKIDYSERWQAQHWRTIFSVYGKSPFFEHYAPVIESLYNKCYERLIDFSKATVDAVKKELELKFEEDIAIEYKKDYSDCIDIRKMFKPGVEKTPIQNNLYYQLFEERNGFFPNLSILDLLFSEGPASTAVMKQHADVINTWGSIE
ncbi:MAG: WbqC family protein [Chitinophagales bacterium]|nr:WbqC family protein [Chitinophagaceae bacterium]MCB9063640.1 WbqC family protein [Chitinophagales bacterium]